MSNSSSSGPGNSTGIAQDTGSSLSSFVTSLVTNTVIWASEVALFIILRTLFRRIYEPRTFVPTVPEKKRTDPLPRTPWSWIPKLLATRTELVISKSGLDGYFLLRYLRNMIYLFGAAILITWPILLPINAVNQRGEAGGVSGMDLLSISNVNSPHRYWAHVIMAIIFITATCWMIFHELGAFVRLRQEYLTSEEHRSTVRASTILVTTVPKNFLDAKTLRQAFSVFPGGVKNVFLNRDCGDLLDKIEDRDKMAKLLELGETKLIITASKNGKKHRAKEEKAAKKKKKKEKPARVEGESEPDQKQRKTNGPTAPSSSPAENKSSGPNEKPGTLKEGECLADKWVPKSKRPTYRIPLASWMPSLPLIGKKVDTIKWAREELTKMNLMIAREQARPDRFEPMNSAFIQFNTQLAAHMACQSVASHRAMYLEPRYIETAPEDVVWDNLQLSWWQRLVRVYSINAIIATMVLFYSIPTAFVGTISNVTYLTAKVPWLRFINKLPSKILGLITGLLPSVMIALWLTLLPFVLRLACRYQGHPTRSVIELAVQNMYFAFLVIQLFLVVSIASSTTAVISQLIDNPTSVTSILAANLPKSSNFFFSYLLLQGLAVSAGTLLQIVALILFYILSKLDSTPRKMWTRFNTLPGLGWGTTYPVFTNLAVIGISYAIISPLIMCFVVATFSLFYFTYLHNFLYVYEFTVDTGGLSFPKALYQTMTGLYFAEICLIGLFFITPGARTQGIVMVVVLILTILFQLQLSASFSPLIQYLPIDIQEELFTKVQAQKMEEDRELDQEAAVRHEKEGRMPVEDFSSVSSKSPRPASPSEAEDPEVEDSRSEYHDAEPGKPEGKLLAFKAGIKTLSKKAGLKKKQSSVVDDDEDIDITHQQKLRREMTQDELVGIAFQHEALRARPPIIWVPEDEFGVARDEIYRTKVESKGGITMSCEGSKLNEKCKVVWTENPPDYVDIRTI